AAIRNTVLEKVMAHDFALQLHGFYADTENKTMRFDVVVSFDIGKKEAAQILTAEITAMYPDYTVQIIPDIDA
ncbi:MAG: cation transporter, partial [Clostridia bacterium]|nr:cation transporter [Clostridia bacterium]